MSEPSASSQLSTDPEVVAWQKQQQIIDAQSDIVKAMTPSLSGTTISKSQLSSTSGSALGGVITGRTASLVADDLAVLINEFTHQLASGKTTVRLIGDLSILDDLAFSLAAREQIRFFDEQINAFLGVPAVKKNEPKTEPVMHAEMFMPSPALLASAGVSVGGQLLAVISQMLTGSYQYSGQTVDPGSVSGLDFSIGHALQLSHSSLKILVDRLEPPVHAGIYHDLAALVGRSSGALQEAINAEKTAAASATKEEAAKHQPRIDQGNSLAAAIAAFATSLLTTVAGAISPPIARAAHGEEMKHDDCLIVYAKVVDSGMDVLTSERLHDQWTALSGVSVEYAIFSPAGQTLTAGTRTVLQRFHGDLKRGLDGLESERITPAVQTEELHYAPFDQPVQAANRR